MKNAARTEGITFKYTHCVIQRFCDVVYGSSHLFASRRPTLRDQNRQSPSSVSGPTSSGSFAMTLTSQSVSSVPWRSKSTSKTWGPSSRILLFGFSQQ
ncbi:hypothetical protein JN853_13875 [Pseudomonas syringae pv. actinidiae ICMP 9853]|uniref:Uncharacterized protein n=1 Tax=Pseudomonas syringae pv. actinidiae TaxID=103796 RepID=A0A2V0QHT8_PSESF|nr:hypothetical protein JN853_13875 [Pseudomonas syringae pv. actinidiae ICMP 9853]GBH09875.1 hypothetical protein KPSA1_03279 [Pseudomonas syringae pv. actinidiae]